jgi:hypothetical protein
MCEGVPGSPQAHMVLIISLSHVRVIITIIISAAAAV